MNTFSSAHTASVGARVHVIGRLAALALKREASLPHKPGLVSPHYRGAHDDMDYLLMLRSAAALEPCFIACAEAGYEFRGDSLSDLTHLMALLQPIGMDGERTMFQTTGGVNTHKGAIFCLGLASAAAGYLAAHRGASTDAKTARGKVSSDADILTSMQGVMRAIAADVGQGKTLASPACTAGMRLYSQYGVRGARGQAEDGYPIVFSAMLPLLKRHHASPRETALLNALLTSIASLDDTCVLSRGGLEGLAFMQKNARDILWMGGTGNRAGFAALQKFIDEATSRRLSPGGSADMLALTIFIDSLVHQIFTTEYEPIFHIEERIDE